MNIIGSTPSKWSFFRRDNEIVENKIYKKYNISHFQFLNIQKVTDVDDCLFFFSYVLVKSVKAADYVIKKILNTKVYCVTVKN